MQTQHSTCIPELGLWNTKGIVTQWGHGVGAGGPGAEALEGRSWRQIRHKPQERRWEDP